MMDESRTEQNVDELGSEKVDQIFETIGKQVEQLALDETSSPDGTPGRPFSIETIESLCMNCGKDVCWNLKSINFEPFLLTRFSVQGETRLLLTKIPYFDDQILSSFTCPHCQYEDRNVQSANEIQEKGVCYTLHFQSPKDLNRALKLSNTATFSIIEVNCQKKPSPGSSETISNLEEAVQVMAEVVRCSQVLVNEADSERVEEIKHIMSIMDLVEQGLTKVTMTFDDPAGSTWLERLPTDTESNFTRKSYERAPWQNKELGFSPDVPQDPEGIKYLNSDASLDPAPKAVLDHELLEKDHLIEEFGGIDTRSLYSLSVNCPECFAPAMNNYHTMDIPHFKEVVISAINCSSCGYRVNDVSTGGAVPEKGKRITLTVKRFRDLNRDILKSQTCSVTIPEFEFNMGPGTMGGRFTTVEGVLLQAKEDLRRSFDNDWVATDEDPADPESKATWERFFDRLDQAIDGELNFTIILEDPLANSYVQSLYAPEPDPLIQIEEYERTEEENEELGLLDMKTRLDADGNYVAE